MAMPNKIALINNIDELDIYVNWNISINNQQSASDSNTL